jgi:lycopene beta-cyclase
MNKSRLIIVGGGLSGCLLAWQLKVQAPALEVLLLERGNRLGGNHTWSFFESDVSTAANALLEQFVVKSWPGYRVRFPKYERTLTTAYKSISSERLHEVLAPALGERVRYGVDVTEVFANNVQLADGSVMEASCVIDARGPAPMRGIVLGYQKFVGLEIETEMPHGQTIPTVMDATVPQYDGYRFVYALPFSANRILIEDTYYSDDQRLDHDVLQDRVTHYAHDRGWKISRTVRKEQGVLPIILAGDLAAFLAHDRQGAPKIGAAASLFHPTTGYSLPDALDLAQYIARHAAQGHAMDSAGVRKLLDAKITELWQARRFFRLLNRMMFRAGNPAERYRIIQRFYRLDPGLVQRFYAAKLKWRDKARLVTGKPPVPFFAALPCVPEAWELRAVRAK